MLPKRSHDVVGSVLVEALALCLVSGTSILVNSYIGKKKDRKEERKREEGKEKEFLLLP